MNAVKVKIAPPALPRRRIKEVDFDPDSEEMQHWWFNELCRWFETLDVTSMQNFSKYASEYVHVGSPKNEILALKVIAEDLFLTKRIEIPESVKAFFRLSNDAERDKFLRTMTADEPQIFERKAISLYAQCRRQGIPISWLEAERYGGYCVKVRRQCSIGKSLELFENKKNEIIDRLKEVGQAETSVA